MGKRLHGKTFRSYSTRMYFAVVAPNTYINDLPERVTSLCKLFANDTTLFPKVINKKNILIINYLVLNLIRQ